MLIKVGNRGAVVVNNDANPVSNFRVTSESGSGTVSTNHSNDRDTGSVVVAQSDVLVQTPMDQIPPVVECAADNTEDLRLRATSRVRDLVRRGIDRGLRGFSKVDVQTIGIDGRQTTNPDENREYTIADFRN